MDRKAVKIELEALSFGVQRLYQQLLEDPGLGAPSMGNTLFEIAEYYGKCMNILFDRLKNEVENLEEKQRKRKKKK